MHELVNVYINSSQNKELAAKIGSEILERSREMANKYLWEGEDVCRFYVAQIYTIVAKELVHWNTIVHWRMKPSLALPWKVQFARNMPQEEFDLLELIVLEGNYGSVVKKTRCVEHLKLTAVTT